MSDTGAAVSNIWHRDLHRKKFTNGYGNRSKIVLTNITDCSKINIIEYYLFLLDRTGNNGYGTM